MQTSQNNPWIVKSTDDLYFSVENGSLTFVKEKEKAIKFYDEHDAKQMCDVFCYVVAEQLI